MFGLVKFLMSDGKRKAGRPRKEDPNKDYNPVTLGVLTDTAFGLSKLPNGTLALVKIKYNPLTGESGTPELNVVDGTPMDAEYAFRDKIDEFFELEFDKKTA